MLLKNVLRLLVGAAVIAAIATLLIPMPNTEAAPDPSTKTVVIACKPGWRGSAVDCFFTGDSATVNKSRADVRLSIR